jgi:general secretion pathway protein C
MLDGFEYDENQNNKQTNKTQQPSKTVLKTSTLTKRELAKNSPIRVNHQPARVDQRLNKALSKQAKAFKDDVGEDPGKIMDYLQIAPKRVDGNIIGYRLMPGKKPDFFKAAGLKSGDVAIQMNGLDLSQPSEAAQALKALRDQRDVSLLLDRDGDITEVLFSIDE